MTGYCRYCGQSFMTEEYEESAANYQATMNCKCEKALAFRDREEIKELAEGHIDALFQDQPAELTSIMKDAVANIAEQRISGITVKISKRLTATIARGKEGIVVKRKYTEENSME